MSKHQKTPQDGFIITENYTKPTDSHLYLPFSSSLPPHCKRAIPYGVLFSIKRNCSTNQFLNRDVKNTKGYLKSVISNHKTTKLI